MRHVPPILLLVTLAAGAYVAALWTGLVTVPDPFFLAGVTLLYAGWLMLVGAGAATLALVGHLRRGRAATSAAAARPPARPRPPARA